MLVRPQVLEAGEATGWQVNSHHRITVVLSGGILRIEFEDGREPLAIRVMKGQADWDEPGDRVHRTVNVGSTRYEEVAVVLPDSDAQPDG